MIKLNHVNENQFYVSSESRFITYDLRTFQPLDEVEEFKGCIDIFNDSENYLVLTGELGLYNYKANKPVLVNNFEGLSDLTHLNCNIQGFTNPDAIILGNSSGDLYYSN
jgi:hypothetical protein